MERFEIIQLARKHRLKPVEAWVLVVLTLETSWRTLEWQGTISELADDIRAARRTVGAACARLDQTGLIEIVEPFGPNRSATIRVLAYAELIRPEARVSRQSAIASNSASAESPDCAAIAPDSRSIRAANAPSDAIDQGKQVAGRKRGSEVERVLPADAEQLCVSCDSEHVTAEAEGFYYCDLCKPFSDDPEGRTASPAQHERVVADAENGSFAAHCELRRVGQLVELFDATIIDEYPTVNAS
jgi:hypothetical protein